MIPDVNFPFLLDVIYYLIFVLYSFMKTLSGKYNVQGEYLKYLLMTVIEARLEIQPVIKQMRVLFSIL